MTTQTPPGISLAELFPGLNEVLEHMGSITGLIIGAAIGALLALGTYLLLRRHRATQRRTTP